MLFRSRHVGRTQGSRPGYPAHGGRFPAGNECLNPVTGFPAVLRIPFHLTSGNPKSCRTLKTWNWQDPSHVMSEQRTGIAQLTAAQGLALPGKRSLRKAFEKKVDPDGKLPHEERQRRAPVMSACLPVPAQIGAKSRMPGSPLLRKPHCH